MYAYNTIKLPFSAELKCGVFSEWFEPFVKDWIDDITHTVKHEISVIFEDCNFEQSVQQVIQKYTDVIVNNILYVCSLRIKLMKGVRNVLP